MPCGAAAFSSPNLGIQFIRARLKRPLPLGTSNVPTSLAMGMAPPQAPTSQEVRLDSARATFEVRINCREEAIDLFCPSARRGNVRMKTADGMKEKKSFFLQQYQQFVR